jgi:AraC family transcriptional regulator, transcriptional activator of pobA
MNKAYNYTIQTPLANINSYMHNGGNAEKNKRFEIHTMEWMESQQLSLNSDAEKLNRFEILWIKKGKGILWVDEQNFEIADNSIYCLAPGCVRKNNFENNVEGYYISFAPEFVWLSEGYSNNSSWLEKYNEDFKAAAIKVDEDTNHELEVIVRKMKWEFSNYFNQRLELLKGLLNIFMIYFSRNLKESDRDVIQTREAELVRKFMGLLKKNFIDQKMVSDYAGKLCVTPNYLNRTVKKVTGFTASHHIQQQIILEAKRKAIYSTVTMKEIAYGLGFDNLAHFSKFFKNNCGMSFTDFKKQALRPD